MAIGPGKYDDYCTEVRDKTDAVGVVMIVLNGNLGSGFSVQIPVEMVVKLPDLLRKVANDIESDFPKT